MNRAPLNKLTHETDLGVGHVHPRTRIRVQDDPAYPLDTQLYCIDYAESVTDLLVLDAAECELLINWLQAKKARIP